MAPDQGQQSLARSPVQGHHGQENPQWEVGTVMYWDGSGWGWWMALMPLVWIVLIGLVVWAVVRLTQGPVRRRDGSERREGRESPEEILDRRYASGEIDTETYNEARKHLATHRPRPR